MARRPDVFDRETFEQALRDQGCPGAYVGAFAGDFKLFVPLLFRQLGADKVLELVNGARTELGLKERDTYWPDAARYFVGWATDAIEAYKGSKGLTPKPEAEYTAAGGRTTCWDISSAPYAGITRWSTPRSP